MTYKTLRLILGDQLNASHSWFRHKDPGTLYLIAELHQETGYVLHHVQKVCAFFSAMEQFAKALVQAGHQVHYLTLDETVHFENLPHLISHFIDEFSCKRFEYQQPDEYRLDQQLKTFTKDLDIASSCVETEHFFLSSQDLPSLFTPAKHKRMENFYRHMRLRFNVLMEGDAPLGGKWNFDENNRSSFNKDDLTDIPAPLVFGNDVSTILNRLERHNIETFGHPETLLVWPTTRMQARSLLQYFCEHCLPRFGQFQDAMTEQSPHAWSLYHSRLSFALNSKILTPHEVVDTAIDAYYQNPDKISISQIEGFVRQILGWREYVRGMYWTNMPNYSEQNTLGANHPLPNWFWTGNTHMNCLAQSIKQSLHYAYAHHIQRLMITGNFSLLAGLNPDQVDEWYLGIYVDAIEWVELPNTRGMALFADGGWIATKPYAASGNYINKMSDYCANCHYKVKEKLTETACPFNSLYWHFIDRHYARFEKNPRMAFPVKQWMKKSIKEKTQIIRHAEHSLKNLDAL